MYPNTSATWSRDGENYRAEFQEAGAEARSIVVFDQYANLLYEDRSVPTTSVPQPISRYHNKTFPSQKLSVRSRSLQKQDGFLYFVEGSDTLRFKKDGEPIPRSNNLGGAK
jgi:hypothetical protein